MSIPEPHPDYSCDKCGQTFVLTGETDADMIRAIAEWPGCCVGEASA